jgi:hypothetical protein
MAFLPTLDEHKLIQSKPTFVPQLMNIVLSSARLFVTKARHVIITKSERTFVPQLMNIVFSSARSFVNFSTTIASMSKMSVIRAFTSVIIACCGNNCDWS